MLPAGKPRKAILEEEEVIINTNIGSPSPLFVRTSPISLLFTQQTCCSLSR